MAGQAQAEAKAKQHTITLEVKDGKFSYRDQDDNDAEKKHAKHQESIGWKSKGKQEFTVDFGKSWPFAGFPVVLTSVNGEIPPRQVAVNPKVETKYKYTVTMPPYTPDDPEIIIDPSE